MSFTKFLKNLEEQLEAPYPERKELLLEIDSHLQYLYDENIENGMSESEAANESIRTMSLDNDFISSISDVHSNLITKVLQNFSPKVSLGIEYITIGSLAVFVNLFLILQEKAMINFLLDGGFFMIPINLMGLAIIFFGFERIYSLYIKKDHSKINLGKRLLSIKYLGWACTIIGIIGTLVGFFQAFSIAPSFTDKAFPIYEVVRIAITTTIWGMTLSFIALTVYFFTKAKVLKIDEMKLQ